MELNKDINPLGDVYVKRLAVYRVMVYYEDDDNILLATTNDIITLYGKTPRLKIRQNGFYPCPYQLLGPALQVLELEQKYTEKSLESLNSYRLEHSRIYKRLALADLFQDVEDAETRPYTVPDEQGEQWPDLKGKSFNILVPFICITKDMYKTRSKDFYVSNEEYHRAMKFRGWPIFYVPSRFE